jgi:hypothetical protein
MRNTKKKKKKKKKKKEEEEKIWKVFVHNLFGRLFGPNFTKGSFRFAI